MNLKQNARQFKKLINHALLPLVLLPTRTFAADVTSVVDNAVEYLQGGLARSVGVIAIVIAGYLCIGKQMFPKMYFAMILVGLGLIYGAAEIYGYLAA